MIRELFYLYSIKRNVYLDETKIKKIQEKKLRKIVKFAYENVPFYKRSFDKNKLNPDDIKTLSDLKKIPVITKNDIRDNYDDFIAKAVDQEKCCLRHTSGSTGKPLKIIEDRSSEAYGTSLKYRAYMENGYKFTDKIFEFTHPRHIVNRPLSLLNKLGILRKYRISVFDPVEKHIEMLNEIKPDIIEGYPSILRLIALKADNLPTPKKIFTTAETLSESDRKLIKEKFNCDVVDFYGCTEIPGIAWECEMHEGYHIDSDYRIVEFLDGEIVVTSLTNYAMPLLRYKVGDYGSLKNEKCSCNRKLSLIKSIEGRKDDFIILPNNKVVSPRCINLLDEVEGISDYKTIQKKKDLFLVQLVKSNKFSEKTLDEIKTQIKKGCFGQEVKIEFEFFNEIPKESNGKKRTIISEVKL